MVERPTRPLGDGRDSRGRFAKGNPGGPGNPLGGRVSRLRTALLNAVSEADIEAIVSRLIAQAKDGDTAAAKEILLRCLGKPEAIDVLERVEELESIVNRLKARRRRTA